MAGGVNDSHQADGFQQLEPLNSWLLDSTCTEVQPGLFLMSSLKRDVHTEREREKVVRCHGDGVPRRRRVSGVLELHDGTEGNSASIARRRKAGGSR